MTIQRLCIIVAVVLFAIAFAIVVGWFDRGNSAAFGYAGFAFFAAGHL